MWNFLKEKYGNHSASAETIDCEFGARSAGANAEGDGANGSPNSGDSRKGQRVTSLTKVSNDTVRVFPVPRTTQRCLHHITQLL